MVKWAKQSQEIIQIITPDGEVFDFSSKSGKGNWVLDISGLGMPDIDYITQQGPFQHGESVRDYRLKSRAVQLSLRQQTCDRDEYWARRTELLNALRPNRDPVGLAGAWMVRSQIAVEGQNSIDSLCVFNNDLFGGAGIIIIGDGILVRWNDANQWVEVAPQLNGQTQILSLVVYDDGLGGGDGLFGGTGAGGRLFKWNGTDTWAQVAAQLVETYIYSMVVFDDGVLAGDIIFAGTGPNGNLYYYNVGVGWVQRCIQVAAQTRINTLCIYDDGIIGDAIYGGTSPNGLLFRYNPAGPAWVQVCAQLNAQTDIHSLCVYNGLLYGGTGGGGRLFQYNVGGGAWTQVAPQYGTITDIMALTVYQGRLYGAADTGELLRWNNTDAWEQVAGTIDGILSMIVFNNRLFSGTALAAYLEEYIRRAGSTDVPCLTLRRYLSDGAIRDLCVFPDKGPEFTSTKSGWDEYSINEVIRLYAPDPILYDPTQENGPTYTMDPTVTTRVNETQTVTYEGTWEEHPTFIITGPITNPIIRNESTDEFIELDLDIIAGTVITITLTPGSQSVIRDVDNANLIGSVTPESNLQSFHLAPDPEVADGDNDISIQGTGTNAATDFSITYYKRYIGI